MNRLEKLWEMELQKPDDAFLKFAIAQEYVSMNQDEVAQKHFENLLEKHPHYIPTYYQLGKLYERMNLSEKAIDVYKRGMEEAKVANELKTLGELNEALMLAQDE